jgi:DNA-binding MarR family transcriptional regulator
MIRMKMSTGSRVRRPPRVRTTPPPLLGAVLRLAWQHVRMQTTEDIRTAGFAGLQDAHVSVFQYPGPDGLRPSDLARQMRMSRQATNYLVAQLETLGYVARRSSGRAERRRVYLTARGRRLTAAIKASVCRVEARCERLVSGPRFDTFMSVLQTIAGQRPLGGRAAAAPGRHARSPVSTRRPSVSRR